MRLTIRVKPGSSRTRVTAGPDGALAVAVTAPAVDGRATEAALRALAEALHVKRRDLRLVTGATSRTKLVDVDDTLGEEELERVRSLIAGLQALS